MSQLLGIVIMTGAACISPVTEATNTTTVYRVQCAQPIYGPVANPFKAVQETNAIAVPPPKKAKKAKKAGRCGAKKTVWFIKNGKRRYKCK